MQLDACLRSIERLAPYAGPVIVIYKSSSANFEAAYEALDLGPRISLVRQSHSFRQDVLNALASAGEHTIFQTDDDLFFRPAASMPALDDSFAAFSLRLGLNTTYCDTHNRAQPLPPYNQRGMSIAWRWADAKDDFAYPMSLDGHLFQTRLLRRMLARASFTNPNELEDELHLRRYIAPKWMLASRQSCVVSVPMNIVTTTHLNRAGSDLRLSAEALNARFLAGERIDCEAMDFSGVRAAHQEIPVAFRQADAKTTAHG